MALDRAPGLNRKASDSTAGRVIRGPMARRSLERRRARCDTASASVGDQGYDGDMQAVRRCQDNIGRLGLEDIVRIRCKDLALVSRPTRMRRLHTTRLGGSAWGKRMRCRTSITPWVKNQSELITGWPVLTSELSLGMGYGF